MWDFFCIFVAFCIARVQLRSYAYVSNDENSALFMNISSRVRWLILLLVLPMMMFGEDAVLHKLLFRSGRAVTGEIVLRNDEVVILKDAYGARFQYPVSDIVEITELKDDEPEQKQTDETHSRSLSNVKRTSLGVRVAGGVASLDGSAADVNRSTLGAAIAADFRLGANNLGGRHIFLGGQVGYRALMTEGKTLSIIPVDVVMELPVITGTHAPMIGANIGYGIGIAGIRGGLNAGLTLAYRYHFSRTGSLHLGVQAEVQQLAAASHSIGIQDDSLQSFLSTGRRTAIMGLFSFGVLF